MCCVVEGLCSSVCAHLVVSVLDVYNHANHADHATSAFDSVITAPGPGRVAAAGKPSALRGGGSPPCSGAVAGAALATGVHRVAGVAHRHRQQVLAQVRKDEVVRRLQASYEVLAGL